MDGSLAGRTVLVVEDDWFIASYVTDALGDAGALVAGPLPTADQALDRLAAPDALPDAATLNIRLLDGDSLPVARRLDELGVPFLFLSASSETALTPEMRERPRLDKPFAGFQVVRALEKLLRN